MDFAKNILNKYGWKEGDGLGKEKQGIKRPIKPSLKFDQAGLGADPSVDFSNKWWERAFNDAAKNVKVKKQENGEVSINLKDAENSVEVTTKSYSIKKMKEEGSKYGNSFLSENAAFSNFELPTNCKALTDEELFKACGGRTAHKGARHGLKLSGKLARLEQQEKELLEKMENAKNASTNDAQAFRDAIKSETESSSLGDLKDGQNSEDTKPKKRKKEKQKEKIEEDTIDEVQISKKKKKSKKK